MIGVTLLALSAVAMAAQAFTIKRTPKQDEVAKYRMKGEFEVLGQQATFTGMVQEKVLKVAEDGNYTIESSQLEGKVNINGQEIEMNSPPSVSVYKPGGDIVEIQGDSSEAAYRSAILNQFFEPGKPVAVGDSWTKEIAGAPRTGGIGAKADFKVLGEEKVGTVDTLKIKATIKETGAEPASTESTVWLSKADSTLVKIEGKWNNVPMPGAPAPISGNVTMTREN
jgi:hypothetical protein